MNLKQKLLIYFLNHEKEDKFNIMKYYIKIFRKTTKSHFNTNRLKIKKNYFYLILKLNK